MTLTAKTASGFYYWFEPNYFRKYAIVFDQFPGLVAFRRRWLPLNWVAIAWATLPRQRIFVFFCFQSTHFFVTDQCVINFVHSATTRSTIVDVGLIHEIDRRRFLLATPIRLKTDNAPWERTFPAGHFPLWHCPDTCVRQDTTRSASAALDAGEPITSQINN